MRHDSASLTCIWRVQGIVPDHGLHVGLHAHLVRRPRTCDWPPQGSAEAALLSDCMLVLDSCGYQPHAQAEQVFVTVN